MNSETIAPHGAKSAARHGQVWVLVLAAGLVLGIGLFGLFVLLAHRHTEASQAAGANLVARDIAGRLKYEALRDARQKLESLREAHGSAGRASSLDKEAVAAKLAAAGFVIHIRRRTSPPPVAANMSPATPVSTAALLEALEKMRYFTPLADGNYLFSLPWADKAKIAGLLGGVPVDAVLAAVRIGREDLQRAALGVLLPGIDMTFYVGDRPSVNLVRGRGELLTLRHGLASVPHEAISQSPTALDLSETSDWPWFLLFGGHEVSGLYQRDETRSGVPHHVAYLRDSSGEAEDWQGVVLAYPTEGEPALLPWRASVVGAAMLLYLFLSALLLWFCAARLRRAAA